MHVCLDKDSGDIADHVEKSSDIVWYGLVCFDVGPVNDANLGRFERVLIQAGCRIVEITEKSEKCGDTYIYALIPMVGRAFSKLLVSKKLIVYLSKLSLASLKFVLGFLNTLDIEYDTYVVPYAESLHERWIVGEPRVCDDD